MSVHDDDDAADDPKEKNQSMNEDVTELEHTRVDSLYLELAFSFFGGCFDGLYFIIDVKRSSDPAQHISGLVRSADTEKMTRLPRDGIKKN